MLDDKLKIVNAAVVAPAPDNLRSLIYFLGLELDSRLAHFRRNAPFESARKSDARTLVAVSRQLSTLSEIARRLGVSRQAVQSSVQRLQDFGLVELTTSSNDKRERIVHLTATGKAALKTGVSHMEQIESEFAELIGREGVETLRKTLAVLLSGIKERNRREKQDTAA